MSLLPLLFSVVFTASYDADFRGEVGKLRCSRGNFIIMH